MSLPRQISQDHIVKIQPSEDVILALDPDTGKELCKFEFDVAKHKVYFNTPTWGKYDTFAIKLVQLFTSLCQHAAGLDTRKEGEKDSDLVKLFNDPDHNPIWRKLSAIAVTARPIVRSLVLDIFFNYLDGYVDGLEISYPAIATTFTEKKIFFTKETKTTREMDEDEKSEYFAKQQEKWFLKHARVDDMQRVFSACLAVNDLIKKNATFLLEKKMPGILTSQAKSSADILQMKPDLTSKNSINTPSSSLERL